MANTTTKVDLVINRMSQSKYEQLKSAGQLNPDQIYMTTDGIDPIPDTREINGKSLAEDVTLTGSDIAVSATDATRIDAALSGKADSSHVHGNITGAGALQTADVTVANGDKLVVTDASDSNKVARTSLAFDGSTATQYLSKKGTWQSLPAASTSASGMVQLNDSLTSTSTAQAATANAVKTLNDAKVETSVKVAGMQLTGDVQLKNLSFGSKNYNGSTALTVTAGDLGALTTHQPISIVYADQHIKLSANNTLVGDIDCADFIKDGMLSSAELCGTTLVLKFNTDAGSAPVSVQLSNFVDDYDEKITGLSAAVNGKVYVDGLSVRSLSVAHIGRDDFYQKVQAGSLLSNEIYIVSGDYVNAYGQQVKNVAMPTDLSDAVNKEYVDSNFQQAGDYLDKREGGEVSGNVGIIQNDLSILSGNIVQTNGSFVGGGEASTAERNSFAYGTGVSAIGENSYAVGNGCAAGCYGWYYKYLDLATGTFYLTTEQPDVKAISAMGEEPEVDASFDSGFAAGDVISYVNKGKHDMCATITEVDGNKITVGALNDKVQEIQEAHPNHDDWTIFVPEKPTAGQIWLGECAFAEGSGSKAVNAYSHAEGGRGCLAYGQYSHAEGKHTKAAYASHSEGSGTEANGQYSHAEGDSTKSNGQYSHAEGLSVEANFKCSHAEGNLSKAESNYAHAEGYSTKAGDGTTEGGWCSHAEGNGAQATGQNSHAEGYQTQAKYLDSHAEGFKTQAFSNYTHAEGYSTKAGNDTPTGGYCAHAEGNGTTASGQHSHSEGQNSTAAGTNAHAEGHNSNAKYLDSHAEGFGTKGFSSYTHAEGYNTTAGNDTANGGYCAHAEGNTTTASGQQSHAEGLTTLASGTNAHSEGQLTTASGKSSHAEGSGTSSKRLVAEGDFSHAEGACTYAKGSASHAEGYNTVAEGGNSHAEGADTQTKNGQEHAEGRFNLSHKAEVDPGHWGNAGNTVHSIGIGTSESNRMNAVEVMQDGKVFIKDIGNYDGTNPTESGVKDVAAAWNDVKSELRYALSTAAGVLSSGSYIYEVNDRTITTIGINQSTTPVIVHLPDADGGARDFILRIEISSETAPTFTFANTAGLDFEAEDDDWAVMQPGVNLISFTETKR